MRSIMLQPTLPADVERAWIRVFGLSVACVLAFGLGVLLVDDRRDQREHELRKLKAGIKQRRLQTTDLII